MTLVAQSKLVRQLRRELTANPKKAGILALVLVLALWMWAPLVLKWTGAKKPPSSDAPVAGAPATAATTTDSAAAGSKKKTHWKQVSQWIESDPSMKASLPAEALRDPFEQTMPKPEATAVAEQPLAAALPPPELTPQKAGLKLHSTIVGTRGKTAFIDSRAFREGQTITAPNGRDKFKLLEVRDRSVLLQNQSGVEYEVKMPRVEVAGVDE